MENQNTLTNERGSLLSEVKPSKAITKLAIPAILALLAKAVYNIVDSFYIGLLNDDAALAAVGVTLPLLLIMVSIENIFASGAAVLAGRQLGEKDNEGANTTITSIVGLSVFIGAILCVLGIIYIEPLMKTFGATENVLGPAKDYAFWMFIAALFNLPAQSMNFAARAESSVKISMISVTVGALLNVVLDPIFMFDWGFGMGVEGASLATSISQAVSFLILVWFYFSGRSIIKIKPQFFKPTGKMIKTVAAIGIPTAVLQIFLAVATSLTNIAAKKLPETDLILAAYGVVQRLILIGNYIIMGFMQGYQPVVAFSFGAKNKERFLDSVKFAVKGALILSIVVAGIYIVLSVPLISLFNSNPSIIEYGKYLLISQVILYPAFALCYMMTITFQTIGDSKMGLLLSVLRQGIFYVPLITTLPSILGVKGLYFSQPFADVLTLITCLLLINTMKRRASDRINQP